MPQGLLKRTEGSHLYLVFKDNSFNGRKSSKLLLKAFSKGEYKSKGFGREEQHMRVKLSVPLEFC